MCYSPDDILKIEDCPNEWKIISSVGNGRYIIKISDLKEICCLCYEIGDYDKMISNIKIHNEKYGFLYHEAKNTKIDITSVKFTEWKKNENLSFYERWMITEDRNRKIRIVKIQDVWYLTIPYVGSFVVENGTIETSDKKLKEIGFKI